MDEIKNYFLLGDLHSAALVSRSGSIDWLCLPHFDSPSIFAALLDTKAGHFSIDPAGYTVSSRYIENIAVVEFEFRKKEALFLVHDFMVPAQENICENHFLVRKFIGMQGKSTVTLELNPQSEYASLKPRMVFDHEDLEFRDPISGDVLFLYLPVKAGLSRKADCYEVTFTLEKDEEKTVVLEYVIVGCSPLYGQRDLENQTIRFWHDWIAKGNYFDFHKELVIRSAITLKLMQFYPTGAIVAAPTSSLPESIGGERNWDYRYVWIRDATFTLYALYILGYFEEAERFFEFIKGIVEKREDPDFDIAPIYTITGDPVPEEKILNNLSGFKNSRPVRVGNAARNQFQLDVYGALIDSYYFISKSKIDVPKIHKDLIMNLVNKISETWAVKDNSIWEIRSKVQNFTYSKVMAWVGVNRAVRMAARLGLKEGELRFCQDLEKKIHEWIWINCFEPVNTTFRQYPESKVGDATNLLFVLLHFLNKNDPLTKKIVEQTAKELVIKGALVYRYLRNDGLHGQEGAFLLCSFWLISAWAVLGKAEKARGLFEKLKMFFSENGLLSEEIDPVTGAYLGNFPQSFSHIGFIMSAYYLHQYGGRR